MKTAAIIAEYNPFHTGHKYHLERTRELTGADYILVIMSGHFVQRGAPALLDKYTRAKMALLGGADVVIELPIPYAVSSAEYFAQGAVTLAHRLGVVDVLSFGSEEGQVAPFLDTASALLAREKEMQDTLRHLLKEGLSYPAARKQAASRHLSFSEKQQSLLSSPNNILGLEYCKALLALQSRITPFTIPRQGQDFQGQILPPDAHRFASAGAIRRYLIPHEGYIPSTEDASTLTPALSVTDTNTQGKLPSGDICEVTDQVAPFIPKECFEVFQAAFHDGSFLTEDDLSLLLHHQLLTHRESGFSMYLDCTPDLSDKICKNIPAYTGFSDFCSLLKSKDLTYARISRTLLHILLEVTTPCFYRQSYSQREYFLPYGHLLGFRKSAGTLLSAIKRNSSIPLVTKMADARNAFSGKDLTFLNQELFCASLYEAACRSKKKETALNELRQSPIILA